MSNNILKFIDDEGIEKDDILLLNGSISDFHNLLTSTNYTIYSLTGDWGSGKTTFIKLWEKTLNSADYIHIDAFEMDYETEPFIMFVKHFYKFLKNEKNINQNLIDNFSEKAKKIFSHSMKKIGKIGINIVASKLASQNANEFISEFSDILFDDLVIDESEEASLYDKIKEALNKITEDLETPIYVIVDELDRCRPSFALETLEKIKHIFQVKKIKFILVYNNHILESIIEKTYGISNGNRYLEKFVQKSIVIDNDHYFSLWFNYEIDNLKDNNQIFKSKLLKLENNDGIFSEIKKTYGIPLRGFQTLFANLFNQQGINLAKDSSKAFLMVIIFEIMKMMENKKYNSLKNIIENNDHFTVKSSGVSMILNLSRVVKLDASIEEMEHYFQEYISGKYLRY